jgi:hypothetical protein
VAKEGTASVYAGWRNGPSTDPGYFPIGVWLQDPRRAAAFKSAGINTYVGLWQGPTEEQLAALKGGGMRTVCAWNEVGRRHLDDPTIAAWMHNDEPDNAQPAPGGGYGPPVPAARVIADYERLRTADPSRPVFLNLGQGVANDEWRGRGPVPQDYRDYVKGADIVSFDVYPVVGIGKRDGENYLWYIPKGLDRLTAWTQNRKLLWNIVECTRISEPQRKATPAQVKAEVWMSLIHGSRGIVYFIHQFRPKFVEAALLEDAEMLSAVTAINRQIHELAPVLNSPTFADGVTVAATSPEAPVDALARRHGVATYVFAVGMRNQPAEATFTVRGAPRAARATVLGEGRSVPVKDGKFGDRFDPYGVHLYRIE